MKRLIAFTFSLLFIFVCFASEDRKKSQDILKVDPQNFRVDVDYMLPRRWSGRSVTYGYSLELKNDSVICHLPYLGVAQQADFDTDGLNFEKPITNYSIKKGKKNRLIIEFSCRKSFVDYRFSVTLFPNGDANIYLIPSNADNISYEGELSEE